MQKTGEGVSVASTYVRTYAHTPNGNVIEKSHKYGSCAAGERKQSFALSFAPEMCMLLKASSYMDWRGTKKGGEKKR